MPRPAPLLALGLCAANPITLRALETGHPEELLGAAACVAAVIAASRERSTWAGVLLGLAIANKPWAVLAVLPVMLALQRGHLRALMTAGCVAAVVLAPMLLGGAAGAQSVGAVATAGGEIFQPWQIWWFAGEHGELVQGLTGAKPGYRTAPSWISGIGHPAVVLVGLALGAAGARRLRGGPPEQGLLLLAPILLTRCLLDPWNTAYYALAVPARALRLGGARCAPRAAAHARGHLADVGQLRADAYAGLAGRAGGLLPGLERSARNHALLAALRPWAKRTDRGRCEGDGCA